MTPIPTHETAAAITAGVGDCDARQAPDEHRRGECLDGWEEARQDGN